MWNGQHPLSAYAEYYTHGQNLPDLSPRDIVLTRPLAQGLPSGADAIIEGTLHESPAGISAHVRRNDGTVCRRLLADPAGRIRREITIVRPAGQ